jgi:hypothetical protein
MSLGLRQPIAHLLGEQLQVLELLVGQRFLL